MNPKRKFIILAISALLFHANPMYTQTLADGNGKFVPIDKPNSPMGEAKGISPGRVAWAHDPAATNWDGQSNFWWSEPNNDPAAIDRMLAAVINNVAGGKSIAQSWDILFKYLNKKKGKGNVGYKSAEKIVIKINLNNGSKSNNIDASPQMVHALLVELVNVVKVPQKNITLYDTQRPNIDAVQNYCSKDFPNVQYNQWGGWVADKITYSSPEVKSSETRRFPRAAVEADYMVNMALLKRHSRPSSDWHDDDGQTGVSLNGKNHLGTIDNPSALHELIRDWHRGMGSYNPIVDLMGSKYLGGNTVIYIIDGLYAGSLHEAWPVKWNMPPFNNDWPSSVFASLDEVALESVGLDFLNAEWGLIGNADNYLHEASQAGSPPSKTIYKPDGVQLSSLGVHEHWNNSTDKEYSRNLGSGNGIELVEVLHVTTPPTAPSRLTASTLTSTKIQLKWSDNSDNEDIFRIDRSADGESWTSVATVGADTKTFINSRLVGSTTYYYRVRAENQVGTSKYSNVSFATTPAPVLPPVPEDLLAISASNSKINLNWKENFENVDNFRIERSMDGASWSEIASVDAPMSNYSSSALKAATKYYYRMRAENSNGTSKYSSIASATTRKVTISALWDNKDIGTPPIEGSSEYSNGTFTLTGCGHDIWSKSDQFQFMFQTLHGDGEIVARVVSLTNTDTWAKVGVMLRETLENNSTHVFMLATPDKGIHFHDREHTGNSMVDIGGEGSAPWWLRVVRKDNLFTGYQSPDGITWKEAGSVTISMSETIYAGLAVSSHNPDKLCLAVFTNVKVIPVHPFRAALKGGVRI